MLLWPSFLSPRHQGHHHHSETKKYPLHSKTSPDIFYYYSFINYKEDFIYYRNLSRTLTHIRTLQRVFLTYLREIFYENIFESLKKIWKHWMACLMLLWPSCLFPSTEKPSHSIDKWINAHWLSPLKWNLGKKTEKRKSRSRQVIKVSFTWCDGDHCSCSPDIEVVTVAAFSSTSVQKP